jgi:HD-GYP domain-containing protein (c-di-GMP phosphodiesterase class II)
MISLKIAALMHDIGMIGVRDELLTKHSKLSSHEYKEVMQHALHGAEIISKIKQLSYIVPIVKHHHERYDGEGFPDGLAGEKIPLHARIIALADSFDAMTSNRPYRKSLSYDWAIEEIKRQAGSQFDPELVDIYVKILSSER